MRSTSLGPAQGGTQETAHVSLGRDIKRGQRLVQAQQLRIGHQGAGHRHPLLLTTRHRARPLRRHVLQAHVSQRPRRLLPRHVLVGSPGPQAERHVLQRAQVREEQIVLKHQGMGREG